MNEWLQAQDWGSVPDWLGLALTLLLAGLAFFKRDSISAWVGRAVRSDSDVDHGPTFEPWEIGETDPDWDGEPFREDVWKLSETDESTYRLINESEWRARHVRFDPESPDIVIISAPEILEPGEWIEFKIDRMRKGHRVKRIHVFFLAPDGGIIHRSFDIN